MNYPQHLILPDVPRGYVLNPRVGSISVILPEATTNLVTNPSMEKDTTGYEAFPGGTITRTSTKQRRGAYSIQYTPTATSTDGIRRLITLSSNTTYTFSLDFFGDSKTIYRISVLDFAFTTTLGTTLFLGQGTWTRQSLTFTTNAGTAFYLYLNKSSSSSTSTIYTDGWQVEQKSYPTTYCDGDMVGFIKNVNDFLWTGTPHGSTSTRSATTRAGGRAMNLDAYRFALLALIGLGMTPVINVAQPYVLIGGSQYQRTVPQDRIFTIAGQLDAETPMHLKRLRADLENALDVNYSGRQQPIILRYEDYNCDTSTSDSLDIVCEYVNGLEGNLDNNYAERVGLTFVSHFPWVQSSAERGSVLDYQDSIIDAESILQRDTTGTWRNLSSGVAGGVLCMLRGMDGNLYVGGAFPSLNGVPNTQGIGYWDGSAWHALGTGAAGLGTAVQALVMGPDGSIYAAGDFTSMGGVANTANFAKWNGSSWSALGTGVNGPVVSLAVSADGGVFLTGSFTSAGGVANTTRIAKWTGSVYQALSTGLNGDGTALAYARWGKLYIGGSFTTAGAVSATRVVQWDGSTFTALGSGLSDIPHNLRVGPDGRLYAFGAFVTADGNTVNGVAQWNGTQWAALSGGVSGGDAWNGAFDPSGVLHVIGAFTSAGGVTLADGYARWNNAAFTPTDIDTPGTATLYAILIDPDGTITIGYSTIGTATAAGVVTVTNTGTAETSPKIKFVGPGRIYELTNITANKGIYFDLTLNNTEEAILDLTPDRISFISTWRGNILNTILPGSDLTTWRIVQGDNRISLLMTGTSGNTEASMWWKENFKSINGATY